RAGSYLLRRRVRRLPDQAGAVGPDDRRVRGARAVGASCQAVDDAGASLAPGSGRLRAGADDDPDPEPAGRIGVPVPAGPVCVVRLRAFAVLTDEASVLVLIQRRAGQDGDRGEGAGRLHVAYLRARTGYAGVRRWPTRCVLDRPVRGPGIRADRRR